MTTKKLRPATHTAPAGPVRHHPPRVPRWILWLALGLLPVAAPTAMAADTAGAGQNNSSSTYNVQSYVIQGKLSLSPDTLTGIFSRHTGTNIDLREIIQTAAAVQLANHAAGYPEISVGLAPSHASGVVTLNVFQAVYPQIVLYGQRCTLTNNEVELPALASAPPTLAQAPAAPSPAAAAPAKTGPAASSAAIAAVTKAAAGETPAAHPLPSATPGQIAQDRDAVLKEMTRLAATEKDTRIHVVSTNAGPHFAVEHYVVAGNSLLPPAEIGSTLTNIDGAFGTNVSFEGIRTAVSELQADYRRRGYVTVAVGLPQQKLTNETVKIQVTEGRLVAIHVKGNEYFSSNNVMRALPSLHTNIILNSLIFQAELNRANANQDRQIYPVIGPGPDPGTSDLTLKVKDQLPFHAKEEFNNESSPGTPDFRLNTSAVYDNLWQLEHALGLQYSFSPQQYKSVAPQVSNLGGPQDQWNFYDQPLVANYSTFYRMPLGNPESVEKVIEDNPGSFGYSEATRQFRLPPPSGQADLTFYASRATIDTGLESTYSTVVTNAITEQTAQQDLTINDDLGFRLSTPLKIPSAVQSSLSGGLDFKIYGITSYKTNVFYIDGIETNYNSGQSVSTAQSDASPVPLTENEIQYLPLALRYDGTWRDERGTTSFGLGLSANLWYESNTKFPDSAASNNPSIYGLGSLQNITGSKQSTGHWVILDPSLTRVFDIYTNWTTTLRADGQWASEPLISNEQFGIGGVNSVRGYHEGEVFGDEGWHVSFEQETPPYVVGPAYRNVPLTIRGSVYMDYARVYLIDPQGRPPYTSLWGAGFGTVATIGPHWEARFLFSLPLIGTTTTRVCQPFFNFSLTAQF